MSEVVYSHRLESGTIRLRKEEDGRWSLFFEKREVCSYATPEKAARFVAIGQTGDSRIDGMAERPMMLSEWQG